MNTGVLLTYFVLYLLFGVLGMYGLFAQAIKKYEQNYQLSFTSLPFPYTYLIFAIASLSAFWLCDLHDFIEPMTLIRLLTPLGLTALIFATGFLFEKLGQSLVIIGCVALDVYLQPIGIGNPFPEIPAWETQLFLITLFSVFCIKADITNGVPHTFILPHAITLFGICMLTFIGATPIFVCMCSATLLGSLLGYLRLNFNEIKIELDSISCSAIAFLVFHLIIVNVGEMCFSSYLILTSLFWSELAIAIWNRIVLTHSGSLQENTGYYQMALKYNAETLLISLLRAGCVILLISWFQLFSKNPYSLIVAALLIALWLNGAIGEPLIGKKNFKQINQEFMQNLKENFTETKKALQKRKKK